MTTTRKKGELETTTSGRDPIGDWLDVLESMLGVPAARRRAIRQELEDHLRSRVDDLTITGLTEPEAVRAAVGELGETADLARRFREAASVNRRRLWMHAAMFGLVGGAIAIGTVGVTGGLNQPGAGGAGGPGGAGAGTFAGEVEFASDAFEGMRRYSVHGLVLSDAPLESTAAGDRLVEVITDLVKPAEWERFGGESRIKLLGNTLFVAAPAEVQEGVEWVLASLEEDAERLRAERERRAEEVVESRRAVVEGRIEELNAELERLFDQLGDLSDRSTLNQQAMFRSSPFTRSELTEEQQREGSERSMELIRENNLIEVERELLNERIERIREVLLDLQYGVPGRPDLAGSTMAMPGAGAVSPYGGGNVSRSEAGDRDQAAAEQRRIKELTAERDSIRERLTTVRAQRTENTRSRQRLVDVSNSAMRQGRSPDPELQARLDELGVVENRLGLEHDALVPQLERINELLLDLRYALPGNSEVSYLTDQGGQHSSRLTDEANRVRLAEEMRRLTTERLRVSQQLDSQRAEIERLMRGPSTQMSEGERATKSDRRSGLEERAAMLEQTLVDIDARLERVRKVLLDVEYGRPGGGSSDAGPAVGASSLDGASGSTTPSFDPEPVPASVVPALTGEQMSDRLRAKRRELAMHLGQLESLRQAMTRTESIDQRRSMEQSETNLLRAIRGVESEIARFERSIAQRSPTPLDKGGGLIYVVAAWNDNEPMTFGLPGNGRLKIDQFLRGLDVPEGDWLISVERGGAPSSTVAIEDLLSGKVESGFIQAGDVLELSAAN